MLYTLNGGTELNVGKPDVVLKKYVHDESQTCNNSYFIDYIICTTNIFGKTNIILASLWHTKTLLLGTFFTWSRGF